MNFDACFAVLWESRESDACGLLGICFTREIADDLALKCAKDRRKVRNAHVFVARVVAKVEALDADTAWKRGRRAVLEVRDIPRTEGDK